LTSLKRILLQKIYTFRSLDHKVGRPFFRSNRKTIRWDLSLATELCDGMELLWGFRFSGSPKQGVRRDLTEESFLGVLSIFLMVWRIDSEFLFNDRRGTPELVVALSITGEVGKGKCDSVGHTRGFQREAKPGHHQQNLVREIALAETSLWQKARLPA